METVTEKAQILDLTKTLIGYLKYVQELKEIVSKDRKGKYEENTSPNSINKDRLF